MSTNRNPVSRVAEPLARTLSISVGWGVLAFAIAMTAEIVMRKAFAYSFKGMDELGGFVLAITAAAGASYSMAMRAHTRVDVFLVRFSQRWQRALNTMALVTLAAFATFAAWRGWAVLDETIEFSSSAPNLGIALFWPQLIWVISLVLFAGIACAYAAHALILLATGSPGINTNYGPLSVRDELQEELDALKRRGAPEAGA
ncbi:MAG: TRAP transporter small permease [Beijerinckiaceae bacterium]|nr:TRAP transporter small permease [Beijerinckiaceae bacterium]